MCTKVWYTIVPWTFTAKFWKVAGKYWNSFLHRLFWCLKWWYSTKFGVGQVFNNGEKLESLMDKNVHHGVVNKCSLRAKSASLDVGQESSKVCFLWQGLWLSMVLSPWRVGLDKLPPSQTKPWGGTPGPKVPWVKQVCVFSDKAWSRVQSGLAVLGQGFRSWSSSEKCAPRSKSRLFSGHKLTSFKKWLGNYGKVCPWWLKCWYSTRFRVRLVSNEEKKIGSPLEKMCVLVW